MNTKAILIVAVAVTIGIAITCAYTVPVVSCVYEIKIAVEDGHTEQSIADLVSMQKDVVASTVNVRSMENGKFVVTFIAQRPLCDRTAPFDLELLLD